MMFYLQLYPTRQLFSRSVVFNTTQALHAVFFVTLLACLNKMFQVLWNRAEQDTVNINSGLILNGETGKRSRCPQINS